MNLSAETLAARIEQIALPHIRARLHELKHQPQQMLDYIDELLLDTRDGARRGFDLQTAELLLSLKYDLMSSSGELTHLADQPVLPDGDFKGSSRPALNGYTPVSLPKNW